MSASGNVPIAVIGVAAELPSGTTSPTNLDLHSFFEFLLKKGESYEAIPADRFNTDKLSGRGLGQLMVNTGSFLKDIQLFDYLEFGVTKKDATAMPLAGRKLVESAFLALLDSGIDYRGNNVGCFMSGVAHDLTAMGGYDEMTLTGSFASGFANIANRVSYHLDLRGPSIPTDTACSSSFVATHMAVQALRNGECEAAVVGGAQLNHRFAEWAMYCQGGVLAPDGKCKPFDASADGFSRAEGVVTIVLKPLDAAIRDNDKIYATILGTGINNSGSQAPVNAPVASAQRDAMKRAFAAAHRRPQEVDFLELHATGTASGDPTEANWVGEEFKREDELVIGSLKGNVGHLEITSFLGSLCKVIGMFVSGLVVPNVNLVQRNPSIHWDQYKFRVPLDVEELSCRSTTGLSLVAMTSSGITGTNGHAVVESPPKLSSKVNTFWLPGAVVPGLVIAGGLSPHSTSAVADTLQELVKEYHPHTLARLFGRRSRSLTWHSYAIENEGVLSRFSPTLRAPKVKPPVVFVFSGQGPQHLHMGRGLFQACAIFRQTIMELDHCHQRVTGYSLLERYGLFSGQGESEVLPEVWPIAVTLPAIAMLQIALLDTFRAIGVRPDVVIGHSAGETAVLYASGAGSKEMAMELAIARGKAMSLLEDKHGTMAAVSCTPEEAEKIIGEVTHELGPGTLEIGCYNTPGSVTLSGSASHVDLAVSKAKQIGVFARTLKTRVPVHSAMMELCESQYRELVGAVFDKYQSTASPTVAAYSTVLGGRMMDPFTTQYFWDGARLPVCFTQAMQALTATYSGATFVEISPHPVLSGYISAFAGREATVACPMKRTSEGDQRIEVSGLLESVGKLVVAGHGAVDFDILFGGLGDTLEPPLQYPFAKKEVPYHLPSLMIAKQKQHRMGPMNFPQLHMNAKTHPGLADHLIKDEPIMPAAGYIEMALEFGARKLWNVQFVSILGLSSNIPTPVDVHLEGLKWTIKSAAPGSQYKDWPVHFDRVHATGYLSMDRDDRQRRMPESLSTLHGRLSPVDMKNFYKEMIAFAQFGSMYRRITACFKGVNSDGQEQILVHVKGNDTDLQPEINEYNIHPAILDAAVHVAVHPMITGARGSRYYLPSRIRCLEAQPALYAKPFPNNIYSLLTLVHSTSETLLYEGMIFDEAGNILLTAEDLEVTLHGNFARKVVRRYEAVSEATDIVLQRIQRSPDITNCPLIMQEYARGSEIELQAVIAPLDPLDAHTIWLHAIAGTDGDAAIGFTRSLRREFPAWTVRLAVFDPSWPVDERTAALQYLSTLEDVEIELYIDTTGTVTVPRIEEATAPVSKTAFNPSAPWFQERSRLVQISEPDVAPQQVIVNVVAATIPQANIWSFVGHIKESSKRVVGVTAGPVTNVVVAPRGSFVEIAESESNIPDALAQALVGLALRGAMSNPERFGSTTVAVEDSSAELTARIVEAASKLGASVTTFSSKSTLAQIQMLAEVSPNVIISSTKANADALNLADVLSAGGHIITWQDSEFGIPRLLSVDPWAIGDAIRSVAAHTFVAGNYKTPVEVSGVEVPAEVEYRVRLLSADKAYLLVGGIGSLGIEIAHWMYQHGARCIVLTSRSGRKSVAKASFLTRRRLSHLEVLPDLDLHLVAADAHSLQDMSVVLANLSRPFAGCMLLSVVLEDRSFLAQTKETFEVPFRPKVDAFRVLEQLCSIDDLDFMITFSSVSAMLGNAGQTNYASANTVLAGMTRDYRKAFSIVVPAITDSTVAFQEEKYLARIQHLVAWGLTSSELCEFIGDGILKLRDGPIGEYIPDFDWNAVHTSFGPSGLFNHLVSHTGAPDQLKDGNQSLNLKGAVCAILGLAPEELSPDVPFTAYGLDSLSASTLSHAIAPIVRVTQIQLLADLTFRKLEDLHQTAVRQASDPAAASAAAADI